MEDASISWVEVSSLSQHRVISLSCGSRHSVAVTLTGDVYTWGRGCEGQTGHRFKDDSRCNKSDPHVQGAEIQLLPKLVVIPSQQHEPAELAACGPNFTIIVTRRGVPWAWGEGRCGELGVGLRVSKQSTPVRVCWPDDASKCELVTCGWAHVLALDSDCNLFSWGFNRFGQLGLSLCVSDQNSKLGISTCIKSPNYSLKPRRVVYFPGSVAFADATANSSAALRAEDGMLFTWGSGEARRLGHRPEKGLCTEHIHRPRSVLGLRERCVSSVTLTETVGFAFVPSSVNSAEPTSVPIIGGTKILLWGGGFWKSSGCVVRFTPLDKGTSALETHPRSSIGKYVTPKGAPVGAGKTGILCRMPRFTTACFVFAEVAMNGNDFTTSRVCIRLYDNPTLAAIKPICCSSTDAHDITIIGKSLLETNEIKVRFKELGGQHREWIVPASLTALCDKNDPLDTAIRCKSPCICGGGFPIQTRVAVALNGSDFVTLLKTAFVIHNATILRLAPDCRPLHPSTPPDAVSILGQSFFDSKNMSVNLILQSNNQRYFCRPRYVNKNTLAFTPPSLAEISQCIRGRDCSDIATEQDIAQAAPVLEEQTTWTFILRLTLDGVYFLNESLSLVLYKQIRQGDTKEISSMCGPLIGGTRLSLHFPYLSPAPVLTCFTSAVVRLRPRDNMSAHIEPIIVSLKCSKAREFSFETPVVDFDSIVVSSKSDTLVEAASSSSSHFKLPIERLDMLVEVALDGQTFGAHCSTCFTYYGTPEVTEIKAPQYDAYNVPAAAAGMDVSIFGRSFFDTGLVKVVLRSSVAPLRHVKTHIIDAVCTRGVVEFVMPILHLFHTACEVSPGQVTPHSHKGCKHRLLVEVSLNGGLNKTSNSMHLDYLFIC